MSSSSACLSKKSETMSNYFVDYNQRQQTESSTSICNSRLPVVPQCDLNETTSWKDAPCTPNRTFIQVKFRKDEKHNIPPRSLYHKDHRDKIYPNYRRMNLNNSGFWDAYGDERKSLLHSMDDWYRCHALCCNLDLTEYQKKQVQFIRSMKLITSKGVSVDKVSYAICAFVCWQDGRRTHPSHKDKDELFEIVRDSLGISSGLEARIFGKVQHHINPKFMLN